MDSGSLSQTFLKINKILFCYLAEHGWEKSLKLIFFYEMIFLFCLFFLLKF